MSASGIICLGVNYRTTPVEVRERVAFPESQLPACVREVQSLPGLGEAVIISTCNRVEIYAAEAADTAADGHAVLRKYVEDHFSLEPAQAEGLVCYRLPAEDTARHLFRVVSGLDSMVLGETEIFGQVKAAYKVALESGTTGRQLNKLFQRAFNVGKLVREKTAIQRGSTSVGSVAVELAEKMFGQLKTCRVMLIGAGEISRTCAQSLVSRGVSSVIVSNRSYDKAVELAAEMKGKALRFDEWESALHEVDIIISSTSAPHFVIQRPMIERVMKSRRGHPLFLIDIAVPRDIDPGINEIEDAFLYNIDELSTIAEDGRRERERQLALCEKIIEEQMDKFGLRSSSAAPGSGALMQGSSHRQANA
jgi:glutamyl-tRNA reductase